MSRTSNSYKLSSESVNPISSQPTLLTDPSPIMWKFLLSLCFALTTAIMVDGRYPEETKYNFIYAVNDPMTYDIKNQWEQRIGDKLRGSYRLVEADGTIRIVDYYADSKNGFRATVRREGQTYHKVAVTVQPPQNVIPEQAVTIPLPSAKRDYYGATFVQEKNYGRGLGYL